jgi:hypothetical protein
MSDAADRRRPCGARRRASNRANNRRLAQRRRWRRQLRRREISDAGANWRRRAERRRVLPLAGVCLADYAQLLQHDPLGQTN